METDASIPETNSGASDQQQPFRIVSQELYYFGFDEDAKEKTRLIVKEKDLQHVREYDIEEDGKNYFCIGCVKKSPQSVKKFAYFHENNFLLAPDQHDCTPVPLIESDFDQEMKTTMFLQAQSEQKRQQPPPPPRQLPPPPPPSYPQPCSSMARYTAAAVAGRTSTGFAKTKNTPKIQPSQQQQYPTEVDGNRKIINEFSASMLDMSTSSSPEYIPESSPSNSARSTPVRSLATNNSVAKTNSVTSSTVATPVLQEQPGLRGTPNVSSPINDVLPYNTAETPSEIRDLRHSEAQETENDKRYTETPDSTHGHYLYNGFSGGEKGVKAERSEIENAAKSSSNLNETLTVDVSTTTPLSDELTAIPREGYEYGYSWRTGSANQRIIVFEPEDRGRVRQYASNGAHYWFCIDCFRIKKKKYKAYFNGETFIAPSAKMHFCDPILYEIAMNQQQEIIEKFKLNKPKKTPTTSDKSNANSVVQSITELAQESDNENESVGTSRVSGRIRYPKQLSPEMSAPLSSRFSKTKSSAATPEEKSIPDYTYLNGLEKRHVHPSDYQYGVGFKNQPKGRIIVFEKDDRNYVREYSRDHKHIWYCRYCLRANKKLYAFLKETGTFDVPPLHSIHCEPKRYVDVMQEQNEIRTRYERANQNLHSPGISLSHIAPVKPVLTAASPQTPAALSSRSPRQRSGNSQASSSSAGGRLPLPPLPNILPIASIEVPVKAISDTEVRQRQRSAGRTSSATSTPRHPVPQSSKSTFIPVFSSASEPSSLASLKYREVDATTYFYGFNERGDLQKRLIVYEEDRRFVREYNSTETDRWKCINCKYGVARKDEDKFIITLKHECTPISATKSKELQDEYKVIAENKGDDSGRLSVSSMNDAQAVDNSQPVSRTTNDLYLNLREKKPVSSSTSSTITSSLREVNSSDWTYGFDSAGEREKRIIVFEPNSSHVYCREYRNDGADTRCLGCAKERRVQARWNDNKLYVPYPDAHCCEPRLFSEIQKRQDKIGAKHGIKRGRSADRTLRNKRTKFVAEDTDTSNSPVGGEDDSYNDMDTSESEQKTVVKTSSSTSLQASTVPSIAVVKDYKPSNMSSTVNYYNPSAFTITECCKKLNITYTVEAYRFWSAILVDQVSPTSRPSQIAPTRESMYHGFSCFSLYLTGNESNTILIREMINRYVYNNFKSLGECMGHDFSQFNHETPLIRETLWSFALTDVHLECISRWFNCRIGIHENGEWKRFGDWDDEDCDTLTFLLRLKDGKYNPILSMNV